MVKEMKVICRAWEEKNPIKTLGRRPNLVYLLIGLFVTAITLGGDFQAVAASVVVVAFAALTP